MSDVSVLIGADASELRRELASADRATAASMNRIAGYSHGLGSKVAGDMIDIGTGTRGAVMWTNALSHVLGGLGSAVAIVGMGKLAESIITYQEKVIAAREETLKFIRAGETGSAFRSTSDIHEHLTAATGRGEALAKERAGDNQPGAIGFANRFIHSATRLGNYLLGGGTPKEQIAEQVAGAASAQGDAEALASKQREANAADRTSLQIDERAGELKKAELKNVERLGEIAKLQGVDQSNLFKAENERYELERTQINRKHDLLQEELELKRRIALLEQNTTDSGAKLEGERVTVSAAARLLTLSEKRVIAAKDELEFRKKLADQRDLPLEEKTKRDTDVQTARNNLHAAAFAQSQLSPDERRAEHAAARAKDRSDKAFDAREADKTDLAGKRNNGIIEPDIFGKGSPASAVKDGVQNPATGEDASGDLTEAASDLKEAASDLKDALRNK